MSNLAIDSFLLGKKPGGKCKPTTAQNNFSERDNHQQTLIADRYDE